MGDCSGGGDGETKGTGRRGGHERTAHDHLGPWAPPAPEGPWACSDRLPRSAPCVPGPRRPGPAPPGGGGLCLLPPCGTTPHRAARGAAICGGHACRTMGTVGPQMEARCAAAGGADLLALEISAMNWNIVRTTVLGAALSPLAACGSKGLTPSPRPLPAAPGGSAGPPPPRQVRQRLRARISLGPPCPFVRRRRRGEVNRRDCRGLSMKARPRRRLSPRCRAAVGPP